MTEQPSSLAPLNKRARIYKRVLCLIAAFSVGVGIFAHSPPAVAQALADLPAWARAIEEAPRSALVIGASTYAHARPLPTSVHDASAMTRALDAVDFVIEPSLGPSPSRTDIITALEAFQRRIAPGSLAVFYFSGHGVERDGVNYLVPATAEKAAPGDEDYVYVSLDFVIETLEVSPAAIVVIVLDACRTDPYANDPESGRSDLLEPRGQGGGGEGLRPPLDLGPSVLVAFSAAGGKASYSRFTNDPPDTASIYTRTLMRHWPSSATFFSHVFDRTSRDVRRDTRGVQEPWTHRLAFTDFMIQPDARDIAEMERAWVAAVLQSSPGQLATELERFLERFPLSPYASAARRQLGTLTQADDIREAEREWVSQSRLLSGGLREPMFVGEVGGMRAFAQYEVPLRAQPRSWLSQEVARLEPGEEVRVDAVNVRGGWALVTTSAGERGYVLNVVSRTPRNVTPISYRGGGDYETDPLDIGALAGISAARSPGDIALIEVGPATASSPGRASQLSYLRSIALRAALLERGWTSDQITVRLLEDQAVDTATIAIVR